MNALDRHGDPLPRGAIARFGTARFACGWGIYALAYSPDGDVIAVASHRGVAILDARDGRTLRTLEGHSLNDRVVPTARVAFARGGEVIASFGADDHARLWSARTGEPIAAVEVKTSVGCVSPDGARVFAVRLDTYTGSVHDFASGRVEREITERSNSTGHVSAWSADGALIAHGTMYGETVDLYDSASGELVRTVSQRGASLSGVGFSPDGRWLVASANLGVVTVWEASTGREHLALEARQAAGALYACAVISSRGMLAVAAGGRIDLYDLASNEKLRSFDVGAWGGNLAFSPDGKVIAHAAQGAIRRFDVDEGRELTDARHVGPVSAIGLSRDRRTLVSASFDGGIALPFAEVRAWSFDDGAPLAHWTPRPGAVAVSPDASWVAVIERDTLAICDPLDGSVRKSWSGEAISTPVAVDESTVSFSLWRTRSMALYDLRSATVTRLDASVAPRKRNPSDGRRAISFGGAPKPTMRVVEVASGAVIAALPATLSRAFYVGWAGDDRVVSVDYKGAVVRWFDATTGEPAGKPLRLLPKDEYVTSGWLAEASHDGRWLAVCDIEGRVRLVDHQSGLVAAVFEGHAGRVASLRFTPDGTALLTGGYDTTVLAWELPRAGAAPAKLAKKERSATRAAKPKRSAVD